MDKTLLFGLGKDQANLSKLDDPWDLPPYFLLRKNMWNCMRTYSGYWKEKEEEHTAIRSSSSSSSASPSYLGVRKTLEFYLDDGTGGGEGTKTDWICHEYHHLRKDDAGEALFLQEDVVLRKVFKKYNETTDHASSLHRHVESCVKAYKEVSSRRDSYGNKLEILSELLKRTGVILPLIWTDLSLAEHMVWLQTDKILELLNRTRSILGSQKFSYSTQSVQALSIEISELLNDIQITLNLAHYQEKTSDWIQLGKALVVEASELVKKLLGELKKDLGGVHCDPDGKSDNVWKHFTKICSTSDPDEVYAACHRCDKVIKAYPKIHGISQLESHRNSVKCRSSCSNPSTDEDREMLHRLRTALNNPNEQQKMDEKLDYQEDLTQLDPWDLKATHPTPWYVTRSLNRQTQGGHWEEINKEFTAIRKDQLQMQGCWKDIVDKEITVVQMDHQFQVQVPQYMGLRRTLQFQHQDGTKMDWIMLEYQQLDDIESPALHLQGDMVIRKVFHYDKDAVTSRFIDLNRWLKCDDDSEEYYYKGEGVNMDSTLSNDYMHGAGDRKRKRSAASKRTSEVWVHFTEIRTADHDVVYAVCHHCDRGYSSGRSTNGTSHLWRHKKSCTSKPRGTGNVNNVANAAWEAEIWRLFLLYKNYGETEHEASGMC